MPDPTEYEQTGYPYQDGDQDGYQDGYPDGYPDELSWGPPVRPARRGPSKRTIVMIVSGGLIVAAVVAICLPLLTGGGDPAASGVSATATTTTTSASSAPEATATTYPTAQAAGAAFLALWQTGDYGGMQELVTDNTPALVGVYGPMDARLGVTRRVIVPGAVDSFNAIAYRATLSLQSLGDFSYAGSVRLMQADGGGWMVDWRSDALHPDLAAGQRLELGQGGVRGDLTDRRGRSLSASEQLTGKVVGTVSGGTGASGLQRSLEDRLAGDPVPAVVIVDTASGEVVKTLMTGPGGSKGSSKGKAVRTTLDLDVQAAAEAALVGVQSRAALVALDTRTGAVLALADVNGGGLPASLLAQEPPGSTFKIITATAALMNGASASTKVPCTTTLSVNGKVFKNHEKNATRTMSLTEAFADSCNTAFIALERGLPDDAILEAAELYGFGIDKPLPVGSEGGHIPAPADSVEAAADAIGQGRVLASPLQMASVAAGVASGTWHQPRLLADCDCESHPIPKASALRTMMRAVVTSGTGSVMAGTPGGKVYAKTGTAEFGSGDAVHAWFVGWQGNIAFAAYVEHGESGGSTAAPLVKKFLTRLDR